MLKIDKGVPLPEPMFGGRTSKYPWRQMEVGDSFFVLGGARNNLNLAASANKHHAPKRFAARSVEGGVRVWRIE